MQRSDPPGAGRQSPIPAFGLPEAANPCRPYDGPIEHHEEADAVDPGRLLACLQAWGQRAQQSGGAVPLPRLHYRIRCAGAASSSLPDAPRLAAALASLSPPLPDAWSAALRRGWPDRVRGLHRIDLVPGAAWVSIELDLEPAVLRRLAARRAAAAAPRLAAPRDAIVVGAGLAGCAMADALLRRGCKVTVIDAADRVGGEVADIPLLAQHPALSPGEDRRSRLLLAALFASRRLAERFGAAMTWCGRFQPMPIAEARLRTAGVPAAVAQPVFRSERALHGVDGLQGIWFAGCGLADPQRWWQQLLGAPGLETLLSRPVAAISRQDDRWQALDAGGRPIASAATMILANQSHALGLAALPPDARGRLRHSRIQVAIGLPLPGAAVAGGRRPSILGGSSYRLEDPGRCCVIGPLRPGIDTLERHDVELPAPTIGDPSYRWQLSEPGQRLLMRDNLPMAGAAPDSDAIDAARQRLERNDRLPLPRRQSLYLLTGLGGRGLLWSVIGAEIIAAAANGEPPVVEPDLEDAVDPARFLKRSLRRARS